MLKSRKYRSLLKIRLKGGGEGAQDQGQGETERGKDEWPALLSPDTWVSAEKPQIPFILLGSWLDRTMCYCLPWKPGERIDFHIVIIVSFLQYKVKYHFLAQEAYM